MRGLLLRIAVPTWLLLLFAFGVGACSEPECPQGYEKMGKICRRPDAGADSDGAQDNASEDAGQLGEPWGDRDGGTGTNVGKRSEDEGGVDAAIHPDAAADGGSSESVDAGLDANGAGDADAQLAAELQDVQQLSAGADHTCAVLGSGSVLCWGANASGQLGDGIKAARSVPGIVMGLTDIVEVAAGGSHTCARKAAGAVFCWGSNAAGQLGDGTTEDRVRPVAVIGMLNARTIAAGSTGSCAITADDKIACWGEGSDAKPENVYLPTGGFKTIAVGSGFACASYGASACWGKNTSALPPVGMAVSSVRDLAAGDNHACAAKNDGTVACWGLNSSGQLGLGSVDPQIAISNAENVSDSVEVAAGRAHSCARLMSGAVKCWGSNESGQLGSETTGRLAALVPGLSNPVEITAGAAHTCVREQRGVAKCWGKNTSGQLGSGGTVDTSSPTIVRGKAP